MSARLRVLLAGEPAGWLRRKANGNLQFAYDAAYVARDGRPISFAMPLTNERFPHRTCLAVFGGLLPEQDVRLAIAQLRGISPNNDFRLLEELGGDCAGAMQFLIEDDDVEAPQHAESYSHERTLDDEELDSILTDLPRRPLAMIAGDSARLSLAGAQGKLPIIVRDETFILPLMHGPPTTHIIKPEPARFPGLVDNEYTCMKLAHQLGLPVAAVSRAHTTSGLGYLLVERYDRMRTNAGTVRIHQEDLCQALARLPHEKYETEGGPTISEAASLVRAATAVPAIDVVNLWDAVMFNVLIGNCDAHGKNYSLLYRQPRPSLAPLYDLVSTAIYPELSSRLAMSVGSATQVRDVDSSAVEACARACGLAPRGARGRCDDLAARLRTCARRMITEPEYNSETAQQVLYDAIDRAERLLG